MTLQFTDLSRILFIDIETVPQHAAFQALNVRLQALWRKKIVNSQWFLRTYEDSSEQNIADSYIKKAGIYAEFGKIVCISAGFIERKGSSIHSFRLKSFFNEDEESLLKDFVPVLAEHYFDPNKHYLCGHNIKEFDIPFLCRRLIVNKIELPEMINVAGRKPWQTQQFIDTLEQWKFGDYKNYTSLDLIAAVLDVPSPKAHLDGSQVASTFYHKENGLHLITKYCELDVLAVARVFLALNHQETITDDMIYSLTGIQESIDIMAGNSAQF